MISVGCDSFGLRDSREFYRLVQNHSAQVSARRATVRKRFDGFGIGPIEPLLPRASQLGRPHATELRSVLYISSTGCQWRQLPKDFPPYSTVQGYFYAWSRSVVFLSINHVLVGVAREEWA